MRQRNAEKSSDGCGSVNLCRFFQINRYVLQSCKEENGIVTGSFPDGSDGYDGHGLQRTGQKFLLRKVQLTQYIVGHAKIGFENKQKDNGYNDPVHQDRNIERCAEKGNSANFLVESKRHQHAENHYAHTVNQQIETCVFQRRNKQLIFQNILVVLQSDKFFCQRHQVCICQRCISG